MAIDFKNKDQMVENVIENLRQKLNVDIDFSTGKVLRTIIEVIMMELDYQYWQMEQVYNNAFIDTAYGDNLDRLVAILGIERIPKTKARGYVKFSRQTPATSDYLIPQGTIVETLEDDEGNAISYTTIETKTLLAGTSEVLVEVECDEEGTIGNIAPGIIRVISNPPLGIESVVNEDYISGGYDGEEDDELRVRAKNALETAGFSTLNAIKYKIFSIPGIKNVKLYDMFRGIGTLDVLILGETIPISPNILNQVKEALEEVKAAGIDAEVHEAELIQKDIEIKLYIRNGYGVADVEEEVTNSIKDYVDNLDIGQRLVVNELYRYVMDNDLIEDMDIIEPSSNIAIEDFQIIRTGNITLT